MNQLKFTRADLDENSLSVLSELAEDFDGLMSETSTEQVFTFEREQDAQSFQKVAVRKLTEFNLNFAAVSDTEPGPQVASNDSPITVSAVDGVEEVEAEDVVTAPSKSNITVYVDSATNTSYSPEDENVSIDIVLNVSLTDPKTHQTSTYKVVKRISLNKEKLADQARSLTPIVVEDKKISEETKLNEEAKLAHLKRMRQNAGLA